jgi:hypothetical protein
MDPSRKKIKLPKRTVSLDALYLVAIICQNAWIWDGTLPPVMELSRQPNIYFI